VRIALVLAVIACPGCGGHATRLAVSPDGRAVLQDAYDGHLDRNWSCSSLRAALLRLPPGGGPVYSTLPQQLGRAAGRACDAALAGIHEGAASAVVGRALGRADATGRCRRYAWQPGTVSVVDGARICLAGGRVARIQVSVHG